MPMLSKFEIPKEEINSFSTFPIQVNYNYLQQLHLKLSNETTSNPQPQILAHFLEGAIQTMKDSVQNYIRGIVMAPTRAARDIGISVSRRVFTFLASILDVLVPFLSGALSPILLTLRETLSSSVSQILQLASNCFTTARSMICNTIAICIAGLAIVCPPEYLGTMGKIFLLASSAIVGFTHSYLAAGAALGLFYLLKQMVSKHHVTVNVSNNYTPLAQPQSSTFKEDTKNLVLDVTTLSVVMTAGFSDLSLPTDGRSWEALLKRHSMLHRSFIGWEFGANKISDIFDRTAHYIFKYLLGREYTSFNYISEVENLYLDVLSLCTLEVNQQIGKDFNLSLKIERMYMDYLKLLRIYAGNRTISSRLQKVGAPLSDFYRRVTDKNPRAHVMRKEPVCIAICGDTGIGKSHMMNRLQQDLLKITGAFDPDRAVENSVYARASEQEFWDGYTGQSIAIYDDFGQRVDSIANPNLEFFEIIRTVNIFSCPLHTAALQDKANTPFTSDFVILTTNLHNFRVESIRSQEAFSRRIHLNLKMFIKQEVSSEPPVVGRNYALKHLSVDKLREYQTTNNLDEGDMSHIIFEIDNQHINYNELVTKISLEFKKHHESFHQRTQNNLRTAPNPLPPGAFTLDSRWSNVPVPQSDFDTDSEVSDISDLAADDGYFTVSEIVRIAEEEQIPDIDNPDLMPDYHRDNMNVTSREQVLQFEQELLEHQFSPLSIRNIMEEQGFMPNDLLQVHEFAESRYQARVLNSPRLINQTDLIFNRFLARRFLIPISRFNPACRRIAMSCYKMLESIREYSTRKFFKYNNWRYWVVASLGIAALGVITMAHMFPSPLDTKMPKLSFVLTSLGLVTTPCLALPLGSTITLTTAASCLMTIPWSYYRIMVSHAQIHPKYMPDCKECESHKSTLEQLPDSFEIFSPEQLAEKVIPKIETNHPSSTLNIPDPESSMKVQLGIKTPNLESSMKNQTAQNSINLESPNRIQIVQNPVLLESIQIESGTRTQTTNAPPKLESTHRPLTEMFPESGRALEDKRKRKPVVEGPKPEGIFCAQLEPLKHILRNNFWILSMKYDDKDTTIGLLTTLKGRKALINFHYLEMMCFMYKEAIDKESVELKFTQPNMKEGHSMKIHPFIQNAKPIYRGQNQTEFYLCQLPKTVHAGRDITKHMINAQEFSKLGKGLQVQLVTCRKISEAYENFSVSGKLESKRTTSLPDLNDPSVRHTYLETIYYELPSLPGDCGSPVLIDSNEFAHKILGFHFAGFKGVGIASPITASDVLTALQDEPFLSDPINIKPSDILDFPLPQSSFYVQGEATEKISHPCKTSIEKSKVFGLFGEPKMVPAILGAPLLKDGPMLRALSKNAGPVKEIDESSLLEEVKQDYFKTCISPFTPLPIEQTVLNFYDACKGIEGNDYFPPIKRGKSAGYPYMAKAKKGKEDWFGAGEWDFSSQKCKELRKDVHDVIERAKFGEIPEAIFVATLKDEKRLIEKVLAKKTRVFSACPQHFLIAFRQYFGGFIAFMGRNKIRNESAIGTNVHGRDWSEIVRHLTPWGEQNISAGDFSDFDGTFQPQIMTALVDSINNFYQGSLEDDSVRKSLWAALVNPLHLLDKFVFTFSHGQPSGSPITAISNSMYVSHSLRYVLWDILKKLEISFRNHVRIIAYGDDSLISFSPYLAQQISSFDIAELFRTKLGMKYTTATKETFSPDDPFQQIGSVSFLKRKFAFDPSHQHWYAPLDLVSIEEMCNWIHKCPSHDLATIENCESSIQELCHHPLDTFNTYSRIIMNACKKESLLVHVPNWEFVRLQMSLGQSDYMTNGRPFV